MFLFSSSESGALIQEWRRPCSSSFLWWRAFEPSQEGLLGTRYCEDRIRWKVSWRRHRLDIKTKVSKAENLHFCFQVRIWKKKLEDLLVCNGWEYCLKERCQCQFWIILSQWEFMSLYLKSPVFLAHVKMYLYMHSINCWEWCKRLVS